MSVEITDEAVQLALQAWGDADCARPLAQFPDRRACMVAALEAAAPAIQESTARRIATKLRILATDRAQMDDMAGSARFKEAAALADAVARGDF